MRLPVVFQIHVAKDTITNEMLSLGLDGIVSKTSCVNYRKAFFKNKKVFSRSKSSGVGQCSECHRLSAIIRSRHSTPAQIALARIQKRAHDQFSDAEVDALRCLIAKAYSDPVNWCVDSHRMRVCAVMCLMFVMFGCCVCAGL